MRENIKDKGRLQHILLAINSVEQYTSGVSMEQMESDKMRIHATAYNIQIIGEAVYNLTKDFKDSRKSTPWSQIEKMRHILVYDYFAVDFDVLWSVVTEDIPILKKQIEKYIEEL